MGLEDYKRDKLSAEIKKNDEEMREKARLARIAREEDNLKNGKCPKCGEPHKEGSTDCDSCTWSVEEDVYL